MLKLSDPPLPVRRQRAFAAVVSAQFFSALGDNALLIAAIGLLAERHASAWMTPALRLFFYLSYVALAAFAGAVADAQPKGRVMLLTNLVKLAGCGLLLAHLHPLLAYALVGLGAAAYSPAKYGILPELLPADELVRANAWIEVSTVLAILFGVALGSLLVADHAWLPRLLPSAAANATLWIGVLYLLAGVCTAAIPRTAASNPTALAHPALLLRRFGAAFVLLWRDRAGQTTMAVTSLFWAISATLQFIILRWAAQVLHLALAQAALLQIAVAVGMIAGAIAAGQWVALRTALRILPIGIAIGAAVLLMTLVSSVAAAVGLLLVIGALSGLFLVPMNALLQQRGTALMHAGQSIAVQNFNENLASLLALAVYGALVYWNAPLLPTIAGFAVLVMLVMTMITAKQMRHGAPDLAIHP